MMTHNRVLKTVNEILWEQGGRVEVKKYASYTVFKAIFKNKRDMSNVDLTVVYWTQFHHETTITDALVYETGDSFYANHDTEVVKTIKELEERVQARINAPRPSEAGVN